MEGPGMAQSGAARQEQQWNQRQPQQQQQQPAHHQQQQLGGLHLAGNTARAAVPASQQRHSAPAAVQRTAAAAAVWGSQQPKPQQQQKRWVAPGAAVPWEQQQQQEHQWQAAHASGSGRDAAGGQPLHRLSGQQSIPQSRQQGQHSGQHLSRQPSGRPSGQQHQLPVAAHPARVGPPDSKVLDLRQLFHSPGVRSGGQAAAQPVTSEQQQQQQHFTAGQGPGLMQDVRLAPPLQQQASGTWPPMAAPLQPQQGANQQAQQPDGTWQLHSGAVQRDGPSDPPPPPLPHAGLEPGAHAYPAQRAPSATLAAQPLAKQSAKPSAKRPLRLTLQEWGLPPGVVQAFLDKGVKQMYPWQAAALECGEDYSNLVYCAPTSGGKSLVAEVLMIRRLLKSMVLVGGVHRKPKYGRALVVLPYTSIVTEKAEHLERVLQPMRATVKGYFGSEESGSALAPRGETVAVCTMEKANVAVNKLAQEGRLGELCCVIVDELHMVGDGHRGAGLELALTKLLFSEHVEHIQVVGMSATMGGLEALRAWLRARLFLTNFRPVPLTEHAVFQGTVFEKLTAQQLREQQQERQQQQAGAEGEPTEKDKTSDDNDDGPLQQLRELPPSASRDKDRLVPLVAEVTAEGHSVLVFCATRKNCETCAAMLAELLPQLAPKDPVTEADLRQQREALLAEMREALGGAVTAELETCILQGVAFHHAGLTAEERAGVEKGYRSGCLQVLTATSTLAAGVNLPARRVILRSLQQGIGPVAKAQYLQMVGRAGRAGQSAVGESFIIGQGPPGGKEWRAICALLTAPVPTLQSQILPESALGVTDLSSGLTEEHSQCLQRLLLEVVANGSVASGEDIQRLLHCTFAAHQHPYALVHAATRAALSSLSTKGGGKALLELQEGSRLWNVTHKGQAVYDSGLPLELAMQLYDDLKQADQGVVLGCGSGPNDGSPGSLQLLFYCMLDHSGFQVANWGRWHATLERLPESHKRVAEAVGVSSHYAQLMRMGRRADPATLARHSRFAAALAINDLMSERSVTEVVERWGQKDFVSTAGVSRGQMQKLQLDVSKWMGMAALLCETAGWWPLATLYTNMAQVAAAGVRQELLGLMRVPGMNAARARVLYKAGIKDPQALAVAEQAALEKVLAQGLAQQMKGRPRSGDKKGAGGGGFAPVAMVKRAAQALLQSARNYIVKSTKVLSDLAEDIAEEEGGDSRPATRAQGSGLPALGGTFPGAAHPAAQLPALQHLQQQQQGGGGSSGGAGGGGSGRVVAGGGLTAEEMADIRRAVQGTPSTPGAGSDSQHSHQVVSIAPDAQHTWTRGLARVEQLHLGTPAEALQQFLALWGSQPRFALALYLKAAGDGKQALQALAVCWQSEVVYYLDLSRRHCAREVAEGTTLLQRLSALLGRQGTHKLCFDADQAVQLLMQGGLALAGPVEDPRVASWLLSPDSLEEVTLKGLHATMAARFQVRVPSLSKAGVTSTCRTALLTLAVMEPLKQLLGAKGMLEAFTSLEMPALLAAAHVSSAAAAGLLSPMPALDQAQSAAAELQEIAARRLQELYCGNKVDLENPDAMLGLLGALKLPMPPKHGRPVVTLTHLQLLLKRCRPQYREQLEALQCLVAYKLLKQALVKPLATLCHGDDEEQQQQQRLQQQQAGPPEAAAAAPAPATPPRLQLSTLTQSGHPSWGQPQDAALGVLLSSHWAALPSSVSMQSVEEELGDGSLHPASLPGLLVAVWAEQDQLRPSGERGQAGLDDGFFAFDQFDQQPPPTPQRLLVVGQVLELSGKRLCTALDFSQTEVGQGSGSSGQGAGSLADGQRGSMARVRVARMPAEGSTCSASGSGGRSSEGAEPLAFPGFLELQLPCTDMWRIAGAAAELFLSPARGALGQAHAQPGEQEEQRSAQQLQQQSGKHPAAPPQPEPPLNAATFPVHGYCSGQGLLLGGAAGEGSTLVCIRLQHLELAVLGAVSGDPVLLAAADMGSSSSSGGGGGVPGGTGQESNPSPAAPASDPYARLCSCWAASACQVSAGGSPDGRQLGVLFTPGAARAVVHALVHGWSHRQLGDALGCDKPQAASLVGSFLAAFGRLGEWWEAAAKEGERLGRAATLGGRQRVFAISAKADAMARGKAVKAMMQFTLGGSVADITKAALVAVQAVVQAGSASPAARPTETAPGMALQAQQAVAPSNSSSGSEGSSLVLAWGPNLVLRVPRSRVEAFAAAVQHSFKCLAVGQQKLVVAVHVTAGSSLHLWDQQQLARA